MNLAVQRLTQQGETIADYEGICGEIANAISQDGDDILYVEPAGSWPLIPLRGEQTIWRYHMVLLRDGLVHDAWCEDVLPAREYLVTMFGAETDVEVSLNGDTVFVGQCQEFQL